MTASHILVVDDDPQIRRVMRVTLIAQGYEVNEARSGEEALVRLHDHRYDLVLLDINLPGASGLEVCRELRSLSDAAIVMLTVRDSERDKIEALDAGADDFVTKPYSTPELLARIRAALRRVPLSPEGGPQVVRLDDVEIDLVQRHIRAGDRRIHLTPKQFDLLHYFITHPNIPLGHTRLLQAVWGPDYGNEVEYLRTFVNQLRKKIEKNPSQPKYLLTEPWVGYRFELPGSESEK
jgi:two-component system, OmpR family, KDP operon response regulator KdpE